MEPPPLRPSLRRKLLVPLAAAAAALAAIVLVAARREMRIQLDAQLLAQARLVADAAHRIAQMPGTREELARFVPLLGSGQRVRSLFIVGGTPPAVIACSWPDWAGRPLAQLPKAVASELTPWLAVRDESTRHDASRGLFTYAAPFRGTSPPAPPAAVLVLQLESAPLQATILRSALRLAALVLLAGASGLGLIAWLLRREVLQPLDALAATNRGAKAHAAPGAAAEFHRVNAALAAAFTAVHGLNAELEQRVSARTAELVASLEREREAARLKTNFVAMVSHEYRNALNVIQTSARLVEKYEPGLDPAERARQLRQIRTACQRLTELVEDVLFYSRAETAGLQPRIVPVDLVALLHELAAAHGDARVHLAGGDEKLSCVTDAALLRHAVGNLLQNAVKYSPATKPVRLRVAREAGAIVITVTDDGPGIPAADLLRLFEPFQRGANVSTLPGMGLGLHIARLCLEALQGTVSIESAAGGGTTAKVRLATN